MSTTGTTTERTVYDVADEHETSSWLGQFNAFPDADVLTPEERKLSVLRLDLIKTHEGVFQPRQFLYNAEDSVKQVASLKKALKKRRPVGKLLVWRAGGQWHCLDGHHRLKAYREVAALSSEWRERLHDIPVSVFVGSKREAHARSIAENAEDKLPTTFGDKQEAAWRMVLQGPQAWTKPQIAHESQVSERLAAEMRMVVRQATHGEIVGLSIINPALFTWKEMKDILNGLKAQEPQDKKDRDQRESYRGQLLRLQRRPQGRRCIRLLMEAMGNMSASVLEVAVQQGQIALDNIQRAKRSEYKASVDDDRAVEEDDGGHLEEPPDDF